MRRFGAEGLGFRGGGLRIRGQRVCQAQVQTKGLNHKVYGRSLSRSSFYNVSGDAYTPYNSRNTTGIPAKGLMVGHIPKV